MGVGVVPFRILPRGWSVCNDREALRETIHFLVVMLTYLCQRVFYQYVDMRKMPEKASKGDE